MKKYFPIFFIISLFITAAFFIATNNVPISLGIFVIYIGFTTFVISPKLSRFNKITNRYHESFHFINSFIISLSIKQSVSAALENTALTMNTNFNELYERLEDMNDNQKISYLESYFPFSTYKLFLQIVDVWQEEGGDILKMSNYLLSEIRYEEEYVSRITTLARNKYVELASLWLIPLVIIVLLRFSLNDFYTKIKDLPVYLISLISVSLFILLSIYMLVNRGTKVELKGCEKNEKII